MVSRKIFSLLVLTLLLSSTVFYCQGQTKPTLSGKVLDQNREAIRGAHVIVARDDSNFPASTVTNEHGEFSIEVTTQNCRLTVSADGFATRIQTVNLTKLSDPIEITLQVADASAVVTITDSSGYLTEAVSSAMRHPTTLRDIPQSISVVSQKQIKDQSLQSISDVVAYIPGVTSHQGENNRDQLIFRGNSSSADFFVNGVRDDVQYYRDLYNLDSIEVLRGPNAMIFGRGGGGGVITSWQGKPADVPISTFFGNPDDSRVRALINLGAVAIEHQAGRLNIRNRTQFGGYDRFYQNFVPGAVTADQLKVALSAYNNATRRFNLFNQTDLTYTLSTGRVRHSLLGGVEIGRQLTDNFRNTGFFNNTVTSILVPLTNPTVRVPVTFRQSATDADNHLNVNVAAGYAQDQT